MALHDAPGNIETETGASADVFGGEERVENPALNLGRNSRAVVAHGDDHAGRVDGGPDAHAPAWCGVDGIVEQVGPDLIELTTVAVDGRQPLRDVDVNGY